MFNYKTAVFYSAKPSMGKAATTETGTNGFRICGIYPVNKQVIPEHAYAPAGVSEICAFVGSAIVGKQQHQLWQKVLSLAIQVLQPAADQQRSQKVSAASAEETAGILTSSLPAVAGHQNGIIKMSMDKLQTQVPRKAQTSVADKFVDEGMMQFLRCMKFHHICLEKVNNMVLSSLSCAIHMVNWPTYQGVDDTVQKISSSWCHCFYWQLWNKHTSC